MFWPKCSLRPSGAPSKLSGQPDSKTFSFCSFGLMVSRQSLAGLSSELALRSPLGGRLLPRRATLLTREMIFSPVLSTRVRGLGSQVTSRRSCLRGLPSSF